MYKSVQKPCIGLSLKGLGLRRLGFEFKMFRAQGFKDAKSLLRSVRWHRIQAHAEKGFHASDLAFRLCRLFILVLVLQSVGGHKLAFFSVPRCPERKPPYLDEVPPSGNGIQRL